MLDQTHRFNDPAKDHYFRNSILDVSEGRLVQGQDQVALVTVEGLIHKPSLFGCATFFHA